MIRRGVKPISDRRRELMLRVADEVDEVFPILQILHGHVRCDDILAFFLKHRLTGRRLMDYISERYDRSFMMLIANTVAQIDRAKLKPLVLGRDIIQN